MKKFMTSSIMVLILIFMSAGFTLAGNGNGGGAGNGSQGSQMGLASVISGLPYEEPISAEIDGLLQMREEEKLARDVYYTLHEKWGLRIFDNIAQSEQQHMTAVKLLLDKYGLTDPVVDSSVGIFSSKEMGALYVQLTEQGSLSLVDALTVGATIEDLDIADLYELLEETDNLDIRTVYQNLAKGSRNHLRAFVYQLSIYDASYSAQYLAQEQIDEILSSEMERGMVDADGNSLMPDGVNKAKGKISN